MTSAPSPSFAVPPHAGEVFARFVACEYCYYTPRGEPLIWPVTPYWYPDRSVVGIATGLAYPNKADYAKRNPRVALLFSDPSFSGVRDAPAVLLQGNATVLDSDIQANTDRYVSEIRRKFLAARLALNPLSVRLLDFYLPRLWVEVTPVRLVVRPPGGAPPEVIGAPLRESGESPPAPRFTSAAGDEEVAALRDWAARVTTGVVAVAGPDGYPMMARTPVTASPDGTLRLADAPGSGPAALTFHYLQWGGLRFDALMARGWVEREDDGHVFIPKRVVGFFRREPGRRNPFLSVFPFSVIPRVMNLRGRLREELARRGQPMPKLRVP